MSKVKLGEVAIEHKETCKGSKDGYPIVGLEHLVPEEVTLTAWDEGSDNTFTKMFRKGNVLFGRRRAYLKKAAVAPFDGICSGDITVIEAIPDRILPELLPFIIQNDDLFDFAVGKSAGSLSPRVKWEHLKNYEFELPDMEKQRELAELLWAMDATKKSYQKLIAATDELVKSQFMEQFGDPVSNTQGREVRPFKDFMLDIRYGTSQPPVFSEDGVFKFIRATNIKAGRITEKDMLRISAEEASKIEKCRLNGNEIIIVRSGANTGDTCVVTEEYRDQYAGYDIIITLDLKIANPVFFNELMNTHYMQAVIKPLTIRAAQPHINSEQVQNLPMLVVALSEQEQFAAFVRQSDKSKFELEQALSELTATYKRIITENLG
ncbi:restriction endonuclease subunit S [bacterium]|nr:restriction endonuclease subunit S [bacterium]